MVLKPAKVVIRQYGSPRRPSPFPVRLAASSCSLGREIAGPPQIMGAESSTHQRPASRVPFSLVTPPKASASFCFFQQPYHNIQHLYNRSRYLALRVTRSIDFLPSSIHTFNLFSAIDTSRSLIYQNAFLHRRRRACLRWLCCCSYVPGSDVRSLCSN